MNVILYLLQWVKVALTPAFMVSQGFLNQLFQSICQWKHHLYRWAFSFRFLTCKVNCYFISTDVTWPVEFHRRFLFLFHIAKLVHILPIFGHKFSGLGVELQQSSCNVLMKRGREGCVQLQVLVLTECLPLTCLPLFCPLWAWNIRNSLKETAFIFFILSIYILLFVIFRYFSCKYPLTAAITRFHNSFFPATIKVLNTTKN